MSQISSIISGWYNVMRDSIGILPKGVKEVVEHRLKICSECPYRTNIVGIDRCGKCGCTLLAKIRSMEKTNKCPIQLW